MIFDSFIFFDVVERITHDLARCNIYNFICGFIYLRFLEKNNNDYSPIFMQKGKKKKNRIRITLVIVIKGF